MKETRERTTAHTKALFKEWEKDAQVKKMDSYKMNPGDFTLWLKYLGTYPAKPTYTEFRIFKDIDLKLFTYHVSGIRLKTKEKILEAYNLGLKIMRVRDCNNSILEIKKGVF